MVLSPRIYIKWGWRNGNRLRPSPPLGLSLPHLFSVTTESRSVLMDGCDIFREELALRYPKLGVALWEPDPQGLKRYKAVAVGDIGYIRGGYFHRLFNAISGPDSDAPRGPKYPPRLQPRDPDHLRKSIDSHQAFFSEKVTQMPRESNTFASR